MFSYRLMRLIETHAESLATALLEKVEGCTQTPHYRKVPRHELEERVYEVYRHLGEWLLGKNQNDIERRYWEIGVRRAQQKVPLSEVIQAIVLTKENLWEFLKREAVVDRAMELLGELELLQMLEQFFDRAIYHAAVGYEQEVAHSLRAEQMAAVH